MIANDNSESDLLDQEDAFLYGSTSASKLDIKDQKGSYFGQADDVYEGVAPSEEKIPPVLKEEQNSLDDQQHQNLNKDDESEVKNDRNDMFSNWNKQESLEIVEGEEEEGEEEGEEEEEEDVQIVLDTENFDKDADGSSSFPRKPSYIRASTQQNQSAPFGFGKLQSPQQQQQSQQSVNSQNFQQLPFGNAVFNPRVDS